MLGVPALQGMVQRLRVNAGEHLADDGATGHRVVTVAVATAKACPRLLAQVFGPQADGLVAAHPAQGGARGDGQHRGQGMAASLAAARVGDVGKEVRQRHHLFGSQHEVRGSMTVVGIEYGTRQAGLGLGVQRADKNALGGARIKAVARAGAPIAAGVTHIAPVGGAVDGAVKTPRIDEGLQQQQRVTETLRPVPHQAAFAQGQHAGGEVRDMVLGQDQKPAVVGDQVQAVVLVAKLPADPGVTRRALPGRGREAQQGQPLPVPGSDIPQRVADLRQRPQVVMRLHQGLETPLFVRSNGLQDDFSQVQTPGLGQMDVERLYTLLARHCPESRATPC